MDSSYDSLYEAVRQGPDSIIFAVLTSTGQFPMEMRPLRMEVGKRSWNRTVQVLEEKIKDLDVIAEDLGFLTDSVRELW